MNINFLLIFFLARYLRTNAALKENNTEVWNERLRLAMYVSIALFIVQILFSDARLITNWLADLSLLGVVYILYTDEIFKQARQILIAVAPYAIASVFTDLIKLIAPDTYKDWHGTLSTISLFAIVWGIGVWFLTIRQKKQLDIANKKVEQQEENNKITQAMKAELEVQVNERTAQLTKQKEELEITVNELKSTQAQLIQSEKMASLGELTAGIAHEIQNPLNFVNNFSEVNKELLTEMNEEISKGNYEDVKAIAKDITDNEEKINHHGKRADAIVKGMLQHSRSSSGQKEATDINALCDEYLRLSYHGLRAKDKTFNATIKTDFDDSIGKINIIPQDIGRVVLNLLTNAFYAVNEKLKAERSKLNAAYEPTVSIQTKKENDKVEISVKDNGSGIPQRVIDKIFQPFFTTKPTGEGTGLGLSLSYDIITKGHNGELKVETKEGEGTTFTIQLPLKN